MVEGEKDQVYTDRLDRVFEVKPIKKLNHAVIRTRKS